MAKSYGLNAAGEAVDVQRGALPRFFPSDLLPFVNNYRFGSTDTDPAVIAAREEEIEAMVVDLCEKGQLQPIIIHPVSGNRFRVHAGDTRHQAFIRIERRGIWPFAKQGDEGRPRIECRVESNGDAKKTFGTSVTENLSRNNLTVIDMANAVAIATDEHRYTDAEILREFKQLKPDGTVKDPAWLPNMRRLARLPVDIKRKIHLKELAPAVGYILAEIPEEEQAAVLADAAGETQASSEAPSLRDWQDAAVDNGLTGFGPTHNEVYPPNVSMETPVDPRSTSPADVDAFLANDPAPTEPTLDYSESQAPPPRAGKTSKTKKVTARAVASAAKKRGLLKHKKVAHTVAGMKSFWGPLATERADSLIAKLAQANLAWIESADDDDFYKAILAVLRGVK